MVPALCACDTCTQSAIVQGAVPLQVQRSLAGRPKEDREGDRGFTVRSHPACLSLAHRPPGLSAAGEVTLPLLWGRGGGRPGTRWLRLSTAAPAGGDG